MTDNLFLGTFPDFREGWLTNYYDYVLDNLPQGVNVLILHPAFDCHEMSGITVDHPNFGSEWRQLDFDYFTSDKCQAKITENNINLINWQDIAIAFK